MIDLPPAAMECSTLLQGAGRMVLIDLDLSAPSPRAEEGNIHHPEWLLHCGVVQPVEAVAGPELKPVMGSLFQQGRNENLKFEVISQLK